MIHWKSLALVLSGILLGGIMLSVHKAYAESARPAAIARCLGPSATSEGVQDDVNRLLAQGFRQFITATASQGGVVCGIR